MENPTLEIFTDQGAMQTHIQRLSRSW